jgi:PD-(D/E)XK endonuclease
MRALGIVTNSEGVLRRIRRDVVRLGLDVSHFKGTRTWDDIQLRRAVASAASWDDVYTGLGLHTPRKETRVRVTGHAMRLGLDLGHLDPRSVKRVSGQHWQVDLMRLNRCATPLAASWFILRGCTVSTPEEGATYDLLADSRDEGILRVQVKSTISKPGNGGEVGVGRRPYSPGNLGPRLPYDPKAIDYFFVVDGDYNLYLIPSEAIAGRVVLALRAYERYIVGNAQGLLAATGPTERAAVTA